jgi:uncharacterized membrane protein YfcA
MIILQGLMILLASAIQGMTSFGFSLVALPLLTILLPINVVVPILVLYSILLNMILLIKLYKHVHLKMITWLLFGGILGMPLGVILLKSMPAELLKLIAGIVIVIVGLLMLMGYRAHLKHPHKWYSVVGVVSGVLQGALSLSGPPVVLFLTNQDADKMTFRANLTAYFTLLNVISIPGFILSGVITVSVMTKAFTLLPFMLIGLMIGIFLSDKIDEKLFKKLTLLLMIVSGVAAIITAY